MKHREARSHRGFRRDEEATIAARFEDYRSFVSQPKRIPNGCPNEVHLVLYEKADKAWVREEIFRRNRKIYEGVTRCVECLRRVIEAAQEGNGWRGEWDHVYNKAGGRCDCPENGRVLCRPCHEARHPRTRFGERSAQEKAAAR